AACASFSKAAVLYQPAVPGFPGAAGFSKNTPMVAASEPKAAVILDAKPKPVDAPITNTFLGPFAILLLDFTYSICCLTCWAVPFVWEVMKIIPLILVCFTITSYFLLH